MAEAACQIVPRIGMCKQINFLQRDAQWAHTVQVKDCCLAGMHHVYYWYHTLHKCYSLYSVSHHPNYIPSTCLPLWPMFCWEPWDDGSWIICGGTLQAYHDQWRWCMGFQPKGHWRTSIMYAVDQDCPHPNKLSSDKHCRWFIWRVWRWDHIRLNIVCSSGHILWMKYILFVLITGVSCFNGRSFVLHWGHIYITYYPEVYVHHLVTTILCMYLCIYVNLITWRLILVIKHCLWKFCPLLDLYIVLPCKDEITIICLQSYYSLTCSLIGRPTTTLLIDTDCSVCICWVCFVEI